MIDNVAVVIRASGERTEAICQQLLEEVIPTENITLIHESPFSRAVQRTCEIGIEYGLPWTLTVDADLLVDVHRLRDFICEAEKRDDSIFFFNAIMIDKFLYMKRQGGVHLYRTKLLHSALPNVDLETVAIRPESHLVRTMNDLGYPNDVIDISVTLHDFEQYYRDIYRTIITHSIRHEMYLKQLYPFWQELAQDDEDFRIALWAYEASQLFTVQVKLDAREFLSNMDDILEFLGVNEKSGDVDITSDIVHERTTRLSNDKRLLKYTKQLESIRSNPRRNPRYWIFRLGECLSEAGKYIQKNATQL